MLHNEIGESRNFLHAISRPPSWRGLFFRRVVRPRAHRAWSVHNVFPRIHIASSKWNPAKRARGFHVAVLRTSSNWLRFSVVSWPNVPVKIRGSHVSFRTFSSAFSFPVCGAFDRFIPSSWCGKTTPNNVPDTRCEIFNSTLMGSWISSRCVFFTK